MTATATFSRLAPGPARTPAPPAQPAVPPVPAGAGQVKVHLGWNNWAIVLPDTSMTAVSNTWVYSTTITNIATQLDCVFNNGAGTWDNNGGQDWHFTVTNGSPPQTPPTPTSVTATAISNPRLSTTI